MSDRIPDDMQIESSLVKRTLANGMELEVMLVRRPRWFEAALFVSGNYRPGPPVPRPLEEPTDTASHWMGVRPRVGLTPDEADEIIGSINTHNFLHRLVLVDDWGKSL